jgi:hypothetical protein
MIVRGYARLVRALDGAPLTALRYFPFVVDAGLHPLRVLNWPSTPGGDADLAIFNADGELLDQMPIGLLVPDAPVELRL